MTTEVSTLVLDLDGTLSDPSAGIIESFRYAFTRHQLPQVDDALIRAQIGPPLDRGFARLTGIEDRRILDELVATYRECYADSGYAMNTLYGGISGALAALSAAGCRLGVCTSKRVDFAERILELFGLRHHFAFVDGGDSGISKGMQLRDLLAAGAIDADAVMIGDRAVDIEAARANGLRSVGVLWGFGDRDELYSARPDLLLEHVAQLPGVPARIGEAGCQ